MYRNLNGNFSKQQKLMYSVRIRRHVMIAHSLPDSAFGPAQRLHGATYIVDAEFRRRQLNKNNIVIDIGLATKLLQEVLEPLEYQNLDELPVFENELTTTEFLCRFIHGKVCEHLNGNFEGDLKVTLGESHVAWAAYEGPVQ